MKDIDKETTVTGLKRAMQGLSDRIDGNFIRIESELRRIDEKVDVIKSSEHCEHPYLQIEISKKGFVFSATCNRCHKEFTLTSSGFMCERAIKKIHKQFLK